ncbi:MAG TPA: 50S ribosomal protein L6 [Spirochaetota bacterium]|nr:50S ribosomal protein L6 [Spirochaetota bacterium]
METATREKRIRVTSRIGDMPITLPSGVTVKQDGRILTVTGPKGTLNENVPDSVGVQIEGSLVKVISKTNLKKDKCFHGLIRALLANMVTGVTTGFTKVLHIEGVGYRSSVKGDKLELVLGYSNDVIYSIPKGITIECDAKENNIKVSGIDKAAVGQVCAEIRAVRPVEPYKGKGVRYLGERVIKKAGKSGGK